MVFIQPIFLEFRTIRLEQCDVGVHGFALNALHPLNLITIDINFDFDYNEGGWIVQCPCNYPGAHTFNEHYHK
jgi:hypothetical protein